MRDDIDVDAGIVLSGKTVEHAGRQLVRFIKDVANGSRTKAEIHRQDILAIHVTREAL